MDLMLDVKALGVSQYAVITQIAAIVFQRDQVDYLDRRNHDFESHLSLDDCIQAHSREIDGPTIRFWLKQQAHVRNTIFDGKESCRAACDRFASYCNSWQISRVWTVNPTTDFVMLQTLFDSCGVNWPFSNHHSRCIRTLIELHPQSSLEKPTLRHVAIEDAKYHANRIIEIMNHLSGRI